MRARVTGRVRFCGFDSKLTRWRCVVAHHCCRSRAPPPPPHGAVVATMRPAYRPSQWHGRLVFRVLRAPAAGTTFEDAKRHERHSPDGQSAVVVPATMHRWVFFFSKYLYCIIIICAARPFLFHYVRPRARFIHASENIVTIYYFHGGNPSAAQSLSLSIFGE